MEGYYMPGAVLDAGDTEWNKSGKWLFLSKSL